MSRKQLSDEQRMSLYLFKNENPLVSQEELGAIWDIDRTTVSKIVKGMRRRLEDRNNSQPERHVRASLT